MPKVITGNNLSIVSVLSRAPPLKANASFFLKNRNVEYIKIIPKNQLKGLTDKSKYYFINKFIPRGTILVQDTANYRVKLTGQKTVPGWYDIEKNYIKGLGRTKKYFIRK